MLEVRLIGKFDIQCDGTPVILSSRAAQSLFAYLILTAGTLHRREKLAGMLWPDENEQKARTYLRNEIWRIRKALPATAKVEYFLADNLTIGFNRASTYWLDVLVFKNISDEATADQRILGLSCYEGEFLAGFYEDWAILERDHLQVLFEHQIARLLEILEIEQRWKDILEWAERWIAFGQAPEAAYRALMIAYSGLGDRAKVASMYERCVQALRQLDLEPSDGTRALAFRWRSRLHVPIPLTSFIGREKELKEVAGLFSKSRLITLTGSGGVGKTRLAIQVVAEVLDIFPDGVWFLDLAPLSEPSLVPNTLASLLRLRESGEIAVTELLLNYFRSRTALVIFDNCEHLIESCAQLINSLLTSCEKLTILATSRETLRVSGETQYRVPSLEIPRSDMGSAVEAFMKVESVQLFIERAALAAPNFAKSSQNVPIIAEICQRLDGIPLAIELAAAQVKILMVEQILQRLDDRFTFLTAGLRTVLPRHQTLRATIEWSYDLLSEKERLLFRRLAVFSGGWTLDAAEEVCSGEGIESHGILNLLLQLVNKSLVMAETVDSESRFRMLETVRQYGREKMMEAGDGEKIRHRHFDYYLQMTKQLVSEYFGPKELVWLVWLDKEWDNLRATVEWSLEANPDAGLDLVNCLGFFSLANPNNIAEMQTWLWQLISHQANSARTATRALGLLHWSWYANTNFEPSIQTQDMIEEAVSITEELGDRNGLARAYLGAALAAEDLEISKMYFKRGLALLRETNNRAWIAFALLYFGWVITTEDYVRRLASLEESLAIYRELGFISGTIEALKQLGALALHEGNFEVAHLRLDESLTIFQEHSYILGNSITMSYDLGDLAYYEGNYELAKIYYENCLSWANQKCLTYSEAWAYARLGYVYTRLGEYEKARLYYRGALIPFLNRNTTDVVIFTLEGFASLAAAECQWEKAIKLFSWSTKQREEIGELRMPIEQAAVDRELAILHSHLTDKEIVNLSAEARQMTLEQAIVFA